MIACYLVLVGAAFDCVFACGWLCGYCRVLIVLWLDLYQISVAFAVGLLCC